MINLRLRMQSLAVVALAGIVLIVACNNGVGGGGGSGGAGNSGDVLGVGNIGGKVNAVSADGMVVVGSANVIGPSSEAFRWTQTGGIQLLGDLPGGDFFSIAEGVSDDGSVVVGYSHSDLANEAFRWAPSFFGNIMTGLGSIANVPASVAFSQAFAVSADGKEVVGTSGFSSAAASEAGRHSMRWKSFAVGPISDAGGDLPFGLVDGMASAIFTDPGGTIPGGIVVGTGVSHTVTTPLADPALFEWHKEAFLIRNGAMTPIGDLTGGFVLPGPFTCASPPCFASGIVKPPATVAICPDCSVDGEVAHEIDSFANDVFVRNAAIVFRTVVVVGSSFRDTLPDSFPEAFRWQENKPFFGRDCAQNTDDIDATRTELCMRGLGDLPGGLKFSEASAISSDVGTGNGDSIIVGYGHTASGRRAFRWENLSSCDPYPDPSTPGALAPCMLELKGFLANLPNSTYEAFDPGDWTFIEATDVSNDGTVIVGNGINPSGEEEGFVIRLTRVP